MASLQSSAKVAENVRLGDEALKTATRKAGTTITRWKPDWEQAARFYREAVKYYRMAGANAQAVRALKGSGQAHEEIQSYHTGAADLEQAAEILAKEEGLQDVQQAVECFVAAYRLYRMNGSHDKSAAMLVRAGETMGTSDLSQAITYMRDACAVFEEESRAMFAEPTFKKAISFAVTNKRYEDAIEIICRQNEVYKTVLDTFEADLFKNYLCLIIIYFHLEDYDRAKSELSAFAEQDERFARSDCYYAAQALCDAYEAGDADMLATALKGSQFKFVLNPVAQLARKLKFTAKVTAKGDRLKKKKEDAKKNGGKATVTESDFEPYDDDDGHEQTDEHKDQPEPDLT